MQKKNINTFFFVEKDPLCGALCTLVQKLSPFLQMTERNYDLTVYFPFIKE